MRRLLVPAVVAVLLAAGCSGDPVPSAPAPVDNTAMVLADASEPGSLNPLLGYAPYGAARFYDGLMEFGPTKVPQTVLAAQQPQPAPDGRSWTVKVRQDGVRFSDGSKLTVDDVVATYQALLDPVYASPLRASYDMLSAVVKVDASTVRFDLAYPYPALPTKLTLGILPHTALTPPGPLANSPVNAKPVGTGPYQLVSWTKGDRMVLQANKSYFGGAPKVSKVTVLFQPDDAKRAEQARAGQLDGAEVSPQQAVAFAKVDGVRVITQDSADFRAITLPTANRVTGDKAVRLALNYAVDRKALIGSALAGKGSPAYTPMPGSMPEFIETQATYRYDKAEAARVLEQAGWVPGADGVRAKDGVQARFTLLYPTGDTERAAVAQAFATQVKAIGVQVEATALAPEAITARGGADAQVLGGGDPFNPDTGFAPVLHTGGALNPGGYSNAQVDTALDNARKATDPARRATAYRQAQRAYTADPGLVVLAFVNHTYVVHDEWTGYQPVTEPAVHGALGWGPWWNLQTWGPR
ncbi:ABC transporter substrate-binding protein [Kutzneria albida]|uniref:Solute-binding protein family 5 domain-containing protein n=1 Tax=Kutzneria albida DSM 43870 TaxID=1449976 RepID=W5WHS6_9PSEU|nr:ABC transporter substrate-binding protein [Kutzneria albida]AHI00423.1 hypothetical protein KALB_7065 [Kutzneria albida DSM 43870]